VGLVVARGREVIAQEIVGAAEALRTQAERHLPGGR
jgi:hypothetical protein